MRIAFIVLVILIAACAPRFTSFKTCEIKYMNTYLEKCQKHCTYEDDGYNCKEACVETAKEKYCN